MSRHSELGTSDLEHMVAGIDISTVEYSVANMAAGVFSVPVKPGVIILGVGHEVKTAFSGGATPTVNVGDGTTANKFAATADIVPGTAGTFTVKLGGANAKKYNASGAIVVTAHVDVTAGAGKLFIFTIDLNSNGRLPAL